MSTTHLMSYFTILPIIEMGRCHPQSTSPHNTTPGHKLARSGGKSSSSMSRWIFLSWITNKNSSCMPEIPASQQPTQFREIQKITEEVRHMALHAICSHWTSVLCPNYRSYLRHFRRFSTKQVSCFHVSCVLNLIFAIGCNHSMSYPQVLQCFCIQHRTVHGILHKKFTNLPTNYIHHGPSTWHSPQRGRVIQGSYSPILGNCAIYFYPGVAYWWIKEWRLTIKCGLGKWWYSLCMLMRSLLTIILSLRIC